MGTDFIAAVVLASSLAVETVQLQILAASLVVALVFRRLPWRYLVPAGLLAICTVTPHVWGLLRPGAAVVTHGMLTSRPWELNLSAPLVQAIRGLGYFEPYWEDATRAGAPMYGVFTSLYPIGVVAALVGRYPFRWRVTGIYALGVLLVAGLDGPLAVPVAAAFERIPAASALRELYDLAVLIVLAGSLGFAQMLSRIPTRIAWVVAAGITLVAVAPWLDRGVLSQTDTAGNSSPLAAHLERQANAAPLTRFLIVPAVNPIGRAANTWGGADPLAFAYGSLMPLWIYIPNGFEPEYLWLIAGDSARVDQNLAISTIVRRVGFTTKELVSPPPVSRGSSFFTRSLIPSRVARNWSDEQFAVYNLDAPLPILQLAPARFGSVSTPALSFNGEH